MKNGRFYSIFFWRFGRETGGMRNAGVRKRGTDFEIPTGLPGMTAWGREAGSGGGESEPIWSRDADGGVAAFCSVLGRQNIDRFIRSPEGHPQIDKLMQ